MNTHASAIVAVMRLTMQASLTAAEVMGLRMENNATVYAVGSGSYQFQTTIKEPNRCR
jgi:hypothetical protein